MPEVIHNTGASRFEIQVDSLTAQLTYYLRTDTIIFTHTGVPAQIEGRGLGSALVRAGLAYARENHLKVKTTCWFVQGYLERHPEYADLYDGE